MSSQIYMLIAVAAVMFCVIGGLSLAHYYTLSGIKSRTVGDGQHGTARFSTKREIKISINTSHSGLSFGDGDSPSLPQMSRESSSAVQEPRTK